MKASRLIILALLIITFSCKDGYIDEITRVKPGPDQSAPQITLKFPAEGTKIKVAALVADIGIDFEVVDDIEVKTIKVEIDGEEVGTITKFLDYRKVIVEDMVYSGLENGDHTITVTATDIENKTTTATANFVKEPPYIPVYAGEKFYMSFNS